MVDVGVAAVLLVESHINYSAVLSVVGMGGGEARGGAKIVGAFCIPDIRVP